MSDLTWSVQDGVGTLTLNRPARKNAFTWDMVDEWSAIVRAAARDDAVRVLVLTGAGGSFCSGVDLDSFSPPGAPPASPLRRREDLVSRVHQVALAMDEFDKPSIAAVQGVAYGAGMDMALMCDFRIVAESARFAESYIKVGLVPGDGGCYYLPRIVGLPRALELLLTGEVVDASQALRIGLANQLVPDEDFAEQVARYAARFAALPPVATRLIKRATLNSIRNDLRGSLDLIASHLAVVATTADSAEALAARTHLRK
jgi:enoyl-CoA hydratase/carnithine racemase